MSGDKMENRPSNTKERKEVKLGDICKITSSTRIYASEYQKKGIPFYRGKEIIKKKQGNLEEPEKFISEERYLEIKSERDVPVQGDLLLTSVGTVGVPYVVDNDEEFYFKDGNIIWFKNFGNQLLSKYLYYWFLSHKGKSKLEKTKIGSSQSAFTITGLKDVKIDLPKLSKQKSVVTILSAFDNLIENNQRRIEILEEIAETIYKEWFVNFNFPGSKDVGMEDSELGEKPKTWNVKKLNDVFKINYGDTLPQKEMYDDGLYPAYAANGVVGYYDDFIRENRVALVSCRGAKSGKVLRTRGPSFITNNSLIIEPHEEFRWVDLPFIYQLLKNRNLQPAISGSAQRQITISSLSPLKFLLPDRDIVEKYCEYVLPTYDLADNYVKRNQKISRIRDFLLPRLISGEIEV